MLRVHVYILLILLLHNIVYNVLSVNDNCCYKKTNCYQNCCDLIYNVMFIYIFFISDFIFVITYLSIKYIKKQYSITGSWLMVLFSII